MGYYIDESYSQPNATSEKLYVLSVARVETEWEGSVRESMLALRNSGELKIRWHQSSPKRRHKLTATVARMPLSLISVAHHGKSAETTERQRRKTLERIIYETNADVSQTLTLESRGIGDDRKDIEFVTKLRSSHSLLESPLIEHVPGRMEPLLWIPDIVCGAVFAYLNGQTEFWGALVNGSGAELIEI